MLATDPIGFSSHVERPPFECLKIFEEYRHESRNVFCSLFCCALMIRSVHVTHGGCVVDEAEAD
jgi:hypothetical protein